MRVRVAVIALLIVAAWCAAGGSNALPARAASGVTIPVVRCPTSFGVAPGRISVPRALTLRGRPGLDRGPHRIYEHERLPDRTAAPALRRRGRRRWERDDPGLAERAGDDPGRTAPERVWRSSVIPACVGCKAEATCHYFPTFRRTIRQLGLVCRPEPPPGEQLRYLTKRLVAFVDRSVRQGRRLAQRRRPAVDRTGRHQAGREPGGVHVELYVAGGAARRMRRQRRRRAQPPRPRSVSSFQSAIAQLIWTKNASSREDAAWGVAGRHLEAAVRAVLRGDGRCSCRRATNANRGSAPVLSIIATTFAACRS